MPNPNVGNPIRGTTFRALPVTVADGIDQEPRLSRYGELIVVNEINTKHLLADSGQYFVATNPTIGTGVAGAISTSFVDTVALFAIKNGDIAGGKRIFLDYIRLIMTGTNPTAIVNGHDFAIRIDSKDRTPTGGNATIIPVNTNMDSVVASVASFQAYTGGANITVPGASGSVRTVGRGHIVSATGITGDEFILQFGGIDAQPGIYGAARTAATPGRFNETFPPVVIGPSQWLTVHRWAATEATNGPSFEYEVGWWEL